MKTIDLEITGGSKALKKMVEHAVLIAKRHLMPRKANLVIEIKITKNLDLAGVCGNLSRNEHMIEILNNGDYIEMIKTVIHEMVHVKQYMRGELRMENVNTYNWKGELIDENIGYENFPWEIEAFFLEEKIFNQYYEMAKGN